jgi:protein MpaA
MQPTEVLSKSALGIDILIYLLGQTHLPKFVLIGGIHGDEPEGSVLVEDFIEKSKSFSKKFKACVLAIPRYNPDGLTRIERTNGNGVDLNRNFPSKDWDNTAKAPRYYPGRAPESESETKGLVKFLSKEKPFLVVHCHTYIPQVCYTGAKSKKWAELLSKDFGHPVTEDIGYPTPGSLGQYCLLNLDTPCVCVELPEGVNRTTAWQMIGESLQKIALHGP